MMAKWQSILLGGVLTIGAVSIGALPTSAQESTAVDPQPFTCEVSDSEVTWTSTDARRYYVRRDLGDGDRYLGSSDGLSFTTPGKFGTFTVISYTGGRKATTCVGTKGPEKYEFRCAIDGPLYWPDQDAHRYYIRAVDDGVSRYLGSTTSPPFDVPPADGYEVIIWDRGVRTVTSCPGAEIAESCNIEFSSIWTAIQAYVAANDGVYPTTLDDLADYMDPLPQRYVLESDGRFPDVVPVPGSLCDY